MTDIKVPAPVKKTPRCPLCHATFDRRFDAARQQKLKEMLDEAVGKWKQAENDKAREKAAKWCRLLEDSIKGGAAEVLLCHFCRIGIGANDPMVGHWEEVYHRGEKILCPACDHEMRFFCTSTGFMLAQCPVKKCRSRMQLSAPDRKEKKADGIGDEAPLYDEKGNPIALPNIDRAIATPQEPAVGQVGGSGVDLELPAETEIKFPEEGQA